MDPFIGNREEDQTPNMKKENMKKKNIRIDQIILENWQVDIVSWLVSMPSVL
jgi:hypothetical protein